jgi:hypothetical protein
MIVAMLTTSAFAQTRATPPTASVAGILRDEGGAPVQGLVTLSNAALQQRVTTRFDGTFEFASLPTGRYLLCARPAPFLARPNDEPFVDSCLWQDRSTPAVSLASGQALRNVTLQAQRGHLLKVRVNDPSRQLLLTRPNARANDLAIHVRGPSGLVQPMPIARQDPLGRDYTLVIPYAPHTVVAHSAAFVLKDASARDLDQTRPIPVNVSRGAAPPPPIVVNIDRRRQ